MRQIEKSKNVVNPWGNGNDVTQTPFEFETLLRYDKNIFFQRNKSPTGFVKCTSCVKYASRVKCAAAREGIYFISHRPKGDISQFPQGNHFTFGNAEYFTKSFESKFFLIFIDTFRTFSGCKGS